MAKDTQIQKYDEEMAKLALEAAKQEAKTGGGNFISTRNAQFKIDGQPVPGNQLAVVIVDSVICNTLYEDDFNPDSPAVPLCYAYGRDEDEMGPHDDAKDPYGNKALVGEEEHFEEAAEEGTNCSACPHNKFGTARKGRGKRCKNGRRIAINPAGNMSKDGKFEAFRDAAQFEKAPIKLLNVPPSSIVGYANFVKQVVNGLGVPPLQVFARMWIEPGDNAYKVCFEALEKAPDNLQAVLLKRMREARGVIEVPFVERVETPKKDKGGSKKARKY